MKIVVIGGTGLIGSKLVGLLQARGHEALAAAPKTGVNTLTGEGLPQALAGAQVLVDVSNSPSFEDEAAMEFFTTSGRTLLAAERAAAVRHHVALSVVGTERMQSSGYFRAKLAQQNLIRESGVPYTIVQATQFFEFMAGIAGSAAEGQTVRLSPAAWQPIASDDVAAVLADVALGAPANGFIQIAGPQRLPLSQAVQQYLAAVGDPRHVVVAEHAPYFGVDVDDGSLLPASGARLGPTQLETWLRQQKKVR